MQRKVVDCATYFAVAGAAAGVGVMGGMGVIVSTAGATAGASIVASLAAGQQRSQVGLWLARFGGD